jgi:large repetitive protein
MKRYSRVFLLLTILIVSVFLVQLVRSTMLYASEPAQDDLQDVWDRVRQSGAYRYDAEVTQVSAPQPSAVNAGRTSKSTTIYMAGETNLKDEAMHLRMWSNGGSVLIPETGIEIKVDGETAVARQGKGAWEEIPNFSGLFAPDGDFTAYSQGAENVVRHEPEIQDTLLGPLEVTRYTYDINGRRLAEQMRGEMLQEAREEGLPAGIELELPRAYAGMSGQGELWVGADGLPLRQRLNLQYPEDAYKYASSATVTVDFSNFAPLGATAGATTLTRFGSSLSSTLSAANNPITAVSLLLIVMVLVAIWIIMTKRSKWVYAAVASFVILSFLSTPLLTVRQLAAYDDRQSAKRADQEEQRAQYEAQQALEEQLTTSSTDPHANPLTTAQQQESKRVASSKMALQTATGSRYFDPLCDSDPSGDADNDTLTNLSECLLGTLPEEADTDQDGADDNLEVVGFTWQGKTWYTNPLIPDTNNDGIGDGKEWHLDANNDGLPDDTNGDGTPDLWDEDNDGDGVRDNLDLSPYMSSGPNSAAPKTFTDESPMLLTMDNLIASELTKVEFQIIPTEDDHLRYSQTVLDWPGDDRQGQLQDADGLTFYDNDNTLDPSPNANGDVRLLPMLEIRMPKDSANLPPSETCTRDDGSTYVCYPILEELNISVREIVEGTLAAYVPLQLVEDSVGGGGGGWSR